MRTPSAPEIAVVVPVGPGASATLPDQVRALAAQAVVRPLHVVLSCNGEPLETARGVLADLELPEDWLVDVLDSSARRGPSAARNIGWAGVSADIVLFCDADDVVGPRWVDAMEQGLRESAICTGPLRFDRVNAAGDWEIRRIDAPVVRFGHLPFGPSANLGLRRELLDRLGGFDEGLLAGEDTDLVWRAAYLGHELHFAEGAEVDYRLRGSLLDVYRNARLYGSWDPALYRRHRPYGARWRPVDGVRHVGSTMKALVMAPLGRRRRRIAANRLGTMVGRLRGSVRHRTVVL